MQQHTSPTPPTLIENCQILPMSTTTISEISKPNDSPYTSLLLKKKLAMFENASRNTTTDVSTLNDTITTPVSLIKPSSTTLSINENEPVKSASRRRKPLRPWSLSARGERPNSTNGINHLIEPISDNDDDDNNQMEMKYSPVNTEPTNSNLEESDEQDIEWPKSLSTIEEILKLYRVETNGIVQCVRCGVNANQDNLLEHVSIHYPYKCYSCGFYCELLSDLDEHNETHSSNTKSLSETAVVAVPPSSIPITTSIKPSELSNGTTMTANNNNNNNNNNSEKSTPPSKAKVHRCRQCSFVSSVKEDYWAHHRVHIRADKILECPSCPFVTEYKHHLEYHLRNHLGSKPFKCSKCDYACVNLSMLRSHKKSHFRHLLFKCSNCSFESKQYQALQEHLQIEGHEPYVDENIEEFLKEYSNGNLNNTTNNNSMSTSPPPSTIITSTNGLTSKPSVRPSASKKRKTAPTTAPIVAKRTSSTSSVGSSAAAMSPTSNDERHLDVIHQQATLANIASINSSIPLVCSLCDYVAVSKEGLGVHLFQHACKKSDLLNRSLLASATMDSTTKLMELFNGKIGTFTNGQLNDFIAPYQQFLTQQIQSHLSSASSLSSTPSGVHSYHLDNNNNHAPPPPPSLLNGGYSLLSSCIKNESNENHLPSSKLDSNLKRPRKGQTPFKYSSDASNDEHSNELVNRHDQQTQVDECQIKRLFECFHCEIIFKDFAMYCTHKQLHYSPDNPFRCAQCGEQKANKYDFFVHVAQQAHELT